MIENLSDDVTALIARKCLIYTLAPGYHASEKSFIVEITFVDPSL